MLAPGQQVGMLLRQKRLMALATSCCSTGQTAGNCNRHQVMSERLLTQNQSGVSFYSMFRDITTREIWQTKRLRKTDVGDVETQHETHADRQLLHVLCNRDESDDDMYVRCRDTERHRRQLLHTV